MKGIIKTAKLSIGEFFKDNALNVAAAIAYYALQAIIPLILGIIVIASFFLQKGEARDNFINAIKGAIPSTGDPNSAFNVGKIIDQLSSSAPGLLSVSALLLLWSGSGIFDQMVFGINVAYDVKKDSRNFFVKLLLRFGLLLSTGLLIAASFVVTILFQLVINADVSLFGLSPKNLSFILPVISYLLPLLLMFGVFLILYKFGPDRKDNKWQYVAVGAAVAAVLFELLKYAFTFYVTAFGASDSYAKSYGALGGVLLFLFYLWLSGAVMLFGAEVASVMAGVKSAEEGPAAQQDPGVKNEAEKLDSDGGVEITPREAAQGKDKNKPATQAEGKEKATGQPYPATSSGVDSDKSKDKDKNKGQQPASTPVPALAARTAMTPDRNNPVSIVVGAIVLALAAIVGVVFRRKDPSA